MNQPLAKFWNILETYWLFINFLIQVQIRIFTHRNTFNWNLSGFDWKFWNGSKIDQKRSKMTKYIIFFDIIWLFRLHSTIFDFFDQHFIRILIDNWLNLIKIDPKQIKFDQKEISMIQYNTILTSDFESDGFHLSNSDGLGIKSLTIRFLSLAHIHRKTVT